MARPATISTDHILGIARRVFMDGGYGASTALIASEAGISEGTIYKRFATKEALFHAAMGLPEVPDFEVWQRRVGTGAVEDVLFSVVQDLIDLYSKLLPRLMMLWSSPTLNPMELVKQQAEPPPVRIVRGLAGVFEAEKRLGRIEPPDVEVCARMLIGSVIHFVLIGMLGLVIGEPMSRDEYARKVVENLMRGLEA